jgi:hypothetical protein
MALIPLSGWWWSKESGFTMEKPKQLLPKDILVNARMFSREEAEKEIMNTAKRKLVFPNPGPTFQELAALQQIGSIQSISTSTGYGVGQFPTTTVTYMGALGSTLSLGTIGSTSSGITL